MDSFATFLLAETLGTPAPWHWVRTTSYLYEAGWTVGNYRYVLKLHHVSAIDGADSAITTRVGPLRGEWSAYFSQVVPAEEDPFEPDDESERVRGDDFRYNITRTGHAFTVFATLIAILKDFVRQVEPSRLVFTAYEDSRKKLYRRLCQMLPTIDPHYQWFPSPKNRYDDEEFVITRKVTT